MESMSKLSPFKFIISLTCFVLGFICHFSKLESGGHCGEKKQFTPSEIWKWHFVIPETMIRRFQFRGQFAESAENSSWISPKVITNVRWLWSLTLIILIRKELSKLLLGSRPRFKSIRSHSQEHRNVWVSYQAGSALRHSVFFTLDKKGTKFITGHEGQKKTARQRFGTKLKHPFQSNKFWIFSEEKNSAWIRWRTHRMGWSVTVGWSISTRCINSNEN